MQNQYTCQQLVFKSCHKRHAAPTLAAFKKFFLLRDFKMTEVIINKTPDRDNFRLQWANNRY